MKKKIKIAHLYYDLMNLYGESGNVRALKRFIERQNVNAEVHFLTIGDKIDFNAYDFYYMGAGSEDNQMLALKDLMPYKEDIKKAVDKGTMFLITGNAMELFGRKIQNFDGTYTECLGIFNYQAQNPNMRLVNEVCYPYSGLPEDAGGRIIGFKNCNCNITHLDKRLFEFAGSMRKNNFFGMNFVGPVLVRNPYFTNQLVEILFKEKNIPYTKIEEGLEFKAYEEYMKKFWANINLD